MHVKNILLFFLVSLFIQSCSPDNADRIFLNCKIYSLDENNSIYEAVAVKNGLIIDLGSTAELREKYSAVEIIDLGGKVVFPGFIDAHGHISGYGDNLLEINLVGTSSQEEIAALVKEKVSQVNPGDWIAGHGWDQNDWKEKGWPDHKILDQAAPNNPVYLTRIDGHALWVNKKALELASITRDTKDPDGGDIKRDEIGNPTGVLIDNAMSLVYKVLPRTTDELIEKTILASVQNLITHGITSVHDMGVGTRTISIMKKLADYGKLPLRIHAYIDGPGKTWNEYLKKGSVIGYGNNFVTVRGIKLFVDGAMGSRGALMSQPYNDDPKNSGLMLMSEDEIYKVTKNALKKGFQVATHGIGDKGINLIFNAYERALKENEKKDHRLRIEHVQVIDPADVERFSKNGIIPSMQPVHATSDMPWAEARLGTERVKWSYALKLVLKGSPIIAGGSDFPVESPSVLEGIYAGVSRQDKNGYPRNWLDVMWLVENKMWVISKAGIPDTTIFEEGWYPDQKLTIHEVLNAFTKWAAYAGFEENKKGTIEIGKWADFTILDKDIMTIPPKEILNTNVVMTVVDGKIVYEKK
ncbi:MAG: amidohydrolase [Bacteroidetes bacterium]|nr:amidohydrolase [Bacteroidota bacterium]